MFPYIWIDYAHVFKLYKNIILTLLMSMDRHLLHSRQVSIYGVIAICIADGGLHTMRCNASKFQHLPQRAIGPYHCHKCACYTYILAV